MHVALARRVRVRVIGGVPAAEGGTEAGATTVVCGQQAMGNGRPGVTGLVALNIVTPQVLMQLYGGKGLTHWQ